MSLARVVTFDGVDAGRLAEMQQNMEGEKPEGLPATEIIVLHDEAASQAIVTVFFDNEEDYATGDAFLNAMDPGETPGARSSVRKCTVAVRMAG